jgi:putative glutamine amidotransferase
MNVETVDVNVIKAEILAGTRSVRLIDLNPELYTKSGGLLIAIKNDGFVRTYHQIEDVINRPDLSSEMNSTYIGYKHELDHMIEDYIARFFIPEKQKPSVKISEDELESKLSKVRVGITYPFSSGIFKSIYPNMTLIRKPEEVINYDLIIVPGGEDVNPTYYGQSNKASDVNRGRDDIEVPIVERALILKKKMFGTCRGHQLINILLKCRYVQDIFSGGFKPHESRHTLHNIRPGSVVDRFFSSKPIVSLHHQGVLGVNSTLRATSSYKDIVESCENSNIITTQFHPEFQEGNEDFFNYLLYFSLGLENNYRPLKQS